MPKVSVIVLNYNGGQIVLRCLRSVKASDYINLELIVVDNASTDDSVYLIQKNLPDVRLVTNKVNLGFAGANNRGYKESSGEFVFILSNDTVVDKFCISELVSLASRNKRIAAIQPKIYLGSSNRFQTAGSFTIFPLSKAYFRGFLEEDKGQYDNICETSYACGAALFARRDVIEEIGLFDESYWFFFEDADFCWRARLASYVILFCPTAKVWHGYRTSYKRDRSYATEMLMLSQRNRLLTNFKNYALSSLLIWFLVEPISFIGMTILGSSYMRTYLKAVNWFLSNIRLALINRYKVQKMRRTCEKTVLKSHPRINPFLLWKSLSVL